MNRRSLLLAIVLALGMGLAAGALVMNQSRRNTTQTKREETVKVVVMANSLTRGVRLKKVDAVLKDWPKRLAPPEFVRNPNLYPGRVLIENVVKGEPLVLSKLAPEDSVEGLSTLIPDGRRAFSVRVTDVSGVGGFLLPGSRVDVLTTIDLEYETKQGRQKATYTKTILQNVEVLAAGEKTEAGSAKKRIRTPVVTLLLTPKQGARLTLAAIKGKIMLALRNPRDKATTEANLITIKELLARKKEKKVPLSPPPSQKSRKKFTVEILHGKERSTASF